jgi:acyl carrier protein
MANVTREQVVSIMNSAGLDSDISKLDPTLPLGKQGVDSLDMINALLAVQEEFNIKISDADMSSGAWGSVDNIVASLNARR